VDKPAGDRPEVGVVVFDDRHEDRRRPPFALGPERVAAFQHAPAVVAATLNAVDLLPQILADVAGPQVAGSAVKAHLPRLAQPVGPDLGVGALAIDEGVVLGDAVVLARVGVIDVDAEDLAPQGTEILPRQVLVSDATGVTGGNVQAAVGTELQAA